MNDWTGKKVGYRHHNSGYDDDTMQFCLLVCWVDRQVVNNRNRTHNRWPL